MTSNFGPVDGDSMQTRNAVHAICRWLEAIHSEQSADELLRLTLDAEDCIARFRERLEGI